MAGNNGPKVQSSGGLANYFSVIAIVASLVVGLLVYMFIMGSPDNFKDGALRVHPKPGNFLALMYKGGFLVPIAMGFFVMLITFSIERFITLARAAGTSSVDVFVHNVQNKLHAGDIDGAIAECDKQRGTVANVTREALKVYKTMAADKELDKESKLLNIQKALEETTALEVPMMEKHLTILATLVSSATLLALLGTVLGMIRAFAGLGEGSGGAEVLAVGISEALINTALGINTSLLATIAYNYFTSRIDDTNFRLDEVGFSIIQTFSAKY